MIPEKNTVKTQHNLVMEDRKKILLTGVNEVESFDDETIILHTELGALHIKGQDLHINKLNVESGELMIQGDIDSCVYSDGYTSTKGGFFSKMFK